MLVSSVINHQREEINPNQVNAAYKNKFAAKEVIRKRKLYAVDEDNQKKDR